MPSYSPSRGTGLSRDIISEEMFGTNFVTIYDKEFTDDDELLTLLGTLHPKTLRYAGGSVTENAFAEEVFLTGNWDLASYVDDRGVVRTLTPLSSFMQVAREVGAAVQLVIPTRVAFEQSMGQALASGDYGVRNQIDSDYLDHVAAYVQAATEMAAAQGVTIARFELGNEFWGSGQMTAREYGYISARLAVLLADLAPGAEIVAQAASSANVYSPLSSRRVLLEPDGSGDYILHELGDGAVAEQGWLEATMPGNGNAREQSETIAGHFADLPGAAAALTGIVEHLYFDGGFDEIDHEKDFALTSIRAAFAARLGLDDIPYHVTEWSARNPGWSADSENLGNANGLQYAHTTVEAFFELASHGVSGANFWPLTFGSPSVIHRTLIDSLEGDLTFGGQAFQWLSTDLPGLSPAFDFDIEGQIDIHGFDSADRMVLLVGERSGQRQEGLRIDLADVLGSPHYFAQYVQMTSSSPDLLDNAGNAVLSGPGGFMLDDQVLTLDAEAWSLSKVVLQRVTDEGDHLKGGKGPDRIEGAGGPDEILGGAGDDTLKGQFGDDLLRGGAGDDVLVGGWGEDHLSGGEGNDWLFGGGESDRLIGGEGADLLAGNGGDDLLDGGPGNDTIRGGDGLELIRAGDGNDCLEIVATAVYGSGVGAHNVGAYGGQGTGVILPLAERKVNTAVLQGGAGQDSLIFGDGADALFLDDEVPGRHHELSFASGARLSSIEQIWTGGGDDIVDLTSRYFSLAGSEIEIDAGSGNDVVWGSDASEMIRGGAGDDTLFGGTGRDTLEGGPGADVFEFTASSSGCVLVDFSAAEGDTLRFYDHGGLHFQPSSLSVFGDMLNISFVGGAGQSAGEIEILFVHGNSNMLAFGVADAVSFV